MFLTVPMNLSLFTSEVVGKHSAKQSLSQTPTPTPTAAASQPLPNIAGLKIQVDPSIANKNGKVVTAKGTRTRVMLCGTYPIGQSNGYSRVVYYLSRYLGLKDDILLTVYGFQNFKQTADSGTRNDIPSSVILHDALATENPTRGGFGDKEIGEYLKSNPQDIVIIFNDMVVTSSCTNSIISTLSPEERSKMKLVSYMDQVYPYQKKQYIQMLNTYFDAVIAFTPYWRETVRKLGLEKRIPCYVLPHGFDHNLYYPIPRDVARLFYNIPMDAFAILNLNRNQPRKRWDHTMMAYAQVVKNYYDLVNSTPSAASTLRPIRLVIGSMLDGSWPLIEIFEHELSLLGVPFQFGIDTIVAIANPQQISDSDVNVIYNCCDIGLNTCEGEGFGLCQIEHLALSSPQVCPKIGGLQEFANSDNSMMIEPKYRYYVDKSRDSIGGIGEVSDPKDFAAAIWKYYMDPELYAKHSKAGREYILHNYRWTTIVDHFHTIIKDIA